MADLISTDYAHFLSDLKSRSRTAQTKAALSVNRELIALYFDMGGSLVAQQAQSQWGEAMFEQLSNDLM